MWANHLRHLTKMKRSQQAIALIVVLGCLGVGLAVAQGPVVGPGTTFEASDTGPTVTITEELELEDPFYYPDGQTVDLSPHANFTSGGDTNVTVEQITGPFTRLATHDITPALTVDPSDKQEVTMAGASVHQVDFGSVNVTSEAVELEYSASEPLEYTLTELPADTDVQAVHTASGDVLATETTGTNGVATYMLPGGDGMTVTFVVQSEEPPEEPPDDEPEVPEISVFDVDILETNSPVLPGETAVVEVRVHNTGTASGTGDLQFSLGNLSSTESVNLASTERETFTFEWQTTGDDVGAHTAQAMTPDDSDSAPVEVQVGGPEFDSGVIADEEPTVITATFDQNVFLNDGQDGMAVSVNGESVAIDDISTAGSEMTVVLAEPVEANDDVIFGYDGTSDNIVNQYDIEAGAFSIQVDNRVQDTFGANLTAIDPTTGNLTNEINLQTTVEEGVVFSAEYSAIPSGVDPTFEFRIGDETFVSEEPDLSEQFLEPGTYNASVTIVGDERSRNATFSLTVVDATAPHVDLAADDPVAVGEDPNLDGTQSEDNVGIANYEWEFGDGETAAGANLTEPAHSYDEPGTYEVTLTVTDTSGNVASNETTVVVEQSSDSSLVDTQWLLLLLLLALLLVLAYYYMRRRQEEQE